MFTSHRKMFWEALTKGSKLGLFSKQEGGVWLDGSVDQPGLGQVIYFSKSSHLWRPVCTAIVGLQTNFTGLMLFSPVSCSTNWRLATLLQTRKSADSIRAHVPMQLRHILAKLPKCHQFSATHPFDVTSTWDSCRPPSCCSAQHQGDILSTANSATVCARAPDLPMPWGSDLVANWS